MCTGQGLDLLHQGRVDAAIAVHQMHRVATLAHCDHQVCDVATHAGGEGFGDQRNAHVSVGTVGAC